MIETARDLRSVAFRYSRDVVEGTLLALKARLAAARTALDHSRRELDQARRALHVAEELAQTARVERETLRGRLHRHERQVLRPDVLADLMPPRAQHRRETAPDELALRREAAHASVSAPYAAARIAAAPAGADHVEELLGART